MEMSHDHYDNPLESVAAMDFRQRKIAADMKRRERVNSGQLKREDTHCSAQSTSHDHQTFSEEDFNLDNVLVLKRD